MAIDPAEDRRAASGVPFLPLGPGITINVAKDAEWRVQVAWGYSGIAITSPSTAAAVVFTPFVYRRPSRLRCRKRR